VIGSEVRKVRNLSLNSGWELMMTDFWDRFLDHLLAWLLFC